LARWARGRLPGWARERVDTDDLVQDVLIGTLRNLERFHDERPGAIESYLRRAVDNRVRDEVRRSRNRLATLETDQERVDDAPSPLEAAIGRQTVERYERALGELPDDVRGLVVARVELEMSYADIAIAVGKPSADAARMAVGRALVALAGAMARDA
jgi:RNA polymerase sigma-70 factor (ECF subfamily)